jgi:predicted dehydrogenase
LFTNKYCYATVIKKFIFYNLEGLIMRLGVIGTSSISHKFIEAAHITKKLKLHSVYSRSFNKGMDFCADYNCNQVYTDIKDLAKSGIDIVYIASPNRLHFEQALFFLSYGLHVICEKPMALNHRDCLKLHEISQKNGVYTLKHIDI